MDTSKATLDSCATSGCGWHCCKFAKNSHIIMLPEEFESADASTNHLEIIDDNYRGGKKVLCKAKDTANCDGGYKPAQCGIYPLWLTTDEKLRSLKCPLSNAAAEAHIPEAQAIIDKYRSEHPDVDLDKFIDEAEVDRYEQLQRDSN